MKGKWFISLALCFMLLSLMSGLSAAQEKPKVQAKAESPVSMLAKAMTDRLSGNLHVKNVVGDPVKVGKVTIIPIILIDIGFGGGGGGSGGGQQMGGYGFGMSGEARPLGFVIISKAGVKFVSVGKVPRK